MKKLLFTIAIIALSVAAQAQDPFVGNNYEHLIRELGTPTTTLTLPIDVVVLQYDETDFFWLDPGTQTVVLQRTYLHPFIARRILKKLQKFAYHNGWYYSTIHDLMIRIQLVNNQQVMEIRPTFSDLADLILATESSY